MGAGSEQFRFCTSRDGVRLAYEISGVGPPLVWVQHWIHQLTADWQSPVWAPWLAALTRRFTLIRYDWRGCGLSDREQVEISFERLVYDLEAVIGAAGVDRFLLFGMAGAGAGAALRYAAENPDRVIRLVLLAPHTKGRLAGSPDPETIDEAEARLKLIELGWVHPVPAYREFFTRLHIPDSTAAVQGAYAGLCRGATSALNASRLLSVFWHVDVANLIPRVSAPTLVCHGQGDCVIPFEEGRRVAALLPNARFTPLQSRNHLLLGSEVGWQQFLAALDGFIPAVDAPPASLTDLTARERETLALLAAGYDNGDIAARLCIAEKTARNHVSAIFRKLGVKKRAQAVALARDLGKHPTLVMPRAN